ncbi:MAG: transporter [Paenibacillaceae bacterium]|nr:transporter [Paenibacillaceae bacterium]
MIHVEGISKTFLVPKRKAGFGHSMKALFHREYNHVKALQDISFHINPGEIVGYIGPNGAGKSTTIKVMSGILVPDEGNCSIMGHTPWKERTRYVQRIGVVFGQRSQLWWDVPVEESFELLKEIYKIPAGLYRQNKDMLTDSLDLGALLQTPVRSLSLGQRMRCEIAASLLHGPELLFLDEPTIGLDAVSKLAVRRFIQTLNREKGVTVILTTHDMSDIEALASRLLLIGKGKLLYDGSLTDLRSRYSLQRTITVLFKERADVLEVPGAALSSWSPERAVYTVEEADANMSGIITYLASRLEILDVTVDAQPIDDLIISLYKEYQI